MDLLPLVGIAFAERIGLQMGDRAEGALPPPAAVGVPVSDI